MPNRGDVPKQGLRTAGVAAFAVSNALAASPVGKSLVH